MALFESGELLPDSEMEAQTVLLIRLERLSVVECGSPVEHLLLFDGQTNFHLHCHAAVLIDTERLFNVIVLRYNARIMVAIYPPSSTCLHGCATMVDL